jgi:putative copper export protein/methionine-rich copper-binding protein CopC
LIAAVAVGLALLSAQNAEAHAAFAKSLPAPGARLEQAPRAITLEFTEPLNRPLTKIALIDLATGHPVRIAIGAKSARVVVVTPPGPLATAAYRVDWHSVSSEDGHPLEGSFGFGIRTAATSAEHSIQLSPFAHGGWLRVVARAVFYLALFFFAGGVIAAAVLGRRDQPAAWLVPDAEAPEGRAVARKAWARTIDAGWIAAAAAAAVAVIEAADASGGLSVAGMREFLLTNLPGLARVGVVVMAAAAALWATRSAALAAGSIAVVFLLIAFSGHANSASPREVAIFSDQAHLLGAAAWVGGIAQIALAWLPRIGSTPLGERLSVMRSVLASFGRLALPAFTLLVAAGLVNAVIQLGTPSALFTTGYGTVLLVKVELVALIAVASYWHAARLRPRLLAANPHPPHALERRHWRLLGVEPVFAGGAVVAAALLVAYPLPPRQVREEADRTPPRAAACDPCPLPKPAADELGVAEQAGSYIATVTMRRTRTGIEGELRMLDSDGKPLSEPAEVIGARQIACASGCWRFVVYGRPRTLTVRAHEKGRTYLARLPARWQTRSNREASRLLGRAQRSMAHLRGVRETERVTSGPGSFAETTYRLEAPDRFRLTTNGGVASVTVGKRQWSRVGREQWRRGRYAGGGPGFKLRSWFTWTAYARSVRLLGTQTVAGRRAARLALMDEATPVWFYLDIDLATMRVTSTRMITSGHYADERFYDFGRPQGIRPPVTP